jgi:hypothetical protein
MRCADEGAGRRGRQQVLMYHFTGAVDRPLGRSCRSRSVCSSGRCCRQSTTGVTRTARKRACQVRRGLLRQVTRRKTCAGCWAAQVATCVAPRLPAVTHRVEGSQCGGGRALLVTQA